MRLFIAVRLSDEMQSEIVNTMHLLKKAGVKGNYVPKQNLHLTMAFIGETKGSAAVQEAMQQVKYKPFKLAFSEMGTFGDLLWTGLKGNQGLSAAVKDIRSALESAGIEFDRQKFVPHITLIRRGELLREDAIAITRAPKGAMHAARVSLMRSDRGKAGMIYTEVGAVEAE